MKTVLFLGFDNKIGLTYHFVDWATTLAEFADGALRIVFVTLNKQQNEGLHDRLTHVRSIDVITIDRVEDLDTLDFLGDVDVVHCHGFKQAARMLKLRRTRKQSFKTAITMHAFRHGSWLRPFYANLVSLLYANRIDAVNFLSHTSKDEFMKYNLFYKKSNRSFVFPLGCNTDEFLRDEPLDSLPFYDDLCQGGKNIIYLAEFSRRKQHIWLLKTVKSVLIGEGAALWLFGGGPEREKVIRYVGDNGLTDHVKLPGRVDRRFIPTILRHMNVAVCASKSENSPHAIMEPMFAGVPVVTLNIGTASYLIRDFSNGFVVRNRAEPDNFRRAVEFLLQNKDAAAAMGKNNQQAANQWLTWQAASRNAVNMYQSMS